MSGRGLRRNVWLHDKGCAALHESGRRSVAYARTANSGKRHGPGLTHMNYPAYLSSITSVTTLCCKLVVIMLLLTLTSLIGCLWMPIIIS